jgi:serine/threonine protein phosphatase PrpC
VAAVSEVGHRAALEDRYVIEAGKGGLFGAVYDGHGGIAAAELAAEHLHRLFFDVYRTGTGPDDAFRTAFAAMDDRIRHVACGTTVTAFFLAGRDLTTANLGDGRLLVAGPGHVRAMTRDHRVDDPAERQRIRAAGGRVRSGYVMRDGRGLMVTRSLGDRWFRAVGVIPVPEVATTVLPKSARHLIVACDGVWDVLDNGQAAVVVRRAAGARAAAQALVTAAARAGSHDNLTALIVRLPADPAEPVAGCGREA